MKLRTDFVTNSSDANFILELKLVDRDGKEAAEDFYFSPVGMATDSPDFYCDSANLDLREIKDEIASVISQRRDVRELCDLLCDSAVIKGEGDEEEEDDYDDAEVEKEPTPLKELYPDGIRRLKDTCMKEGITTASIRYVVADNGIDGTGDSAMWLPFENDVLMGYHQRYAEADEDEKKVILQELVEFMQSEPILTIHDNEGYCEGEQRVVWGNPQTLRTNMDMYLNKVWEEGHPARWEGWDGVWTTEYTYDANTGVVKTKEGLFLSDYVYR